MHSHRRSSDVKVRRQANGNINNDEESARERLLSEDSDEGQRSRSSSKTKLLSDNGGGNRDRVYSSCSNSCSNCTEKDNCDEEITENTPKGQLYGHMILLCISSPFFQRETFCFLEEEVLLE